MKELSWLEGQSRTPLPVSRTVNLFVSPAETKGQLISAS
jgi:hypothetical protein